MSERNGLRKKNLLHNLTALCTRCAHLCASLNNPEPQSDISFVVLVCSIMDQELSVMKGSENGVHKLDNPQCDSAHTGPQKHPSAPCI